ncbi:hypothetical protein BJ170DRAFT_594661 [Xylariales sp. AK1849]|nr:hypothetical protein BJ170DRAFT_594661 [Xylariales sp. AK1849]
MSVNSVIYQDIISWAHSQQGFEAANGHAAPITPAQRKLLLDLHQIIKPLPTPSTEPELDDTNWVGLLHRYRDANPDDSKVRFTAESIGATTSLRWICCVWIQESESPFPRPDQGSVKRSGKGPSFLRKQDAKQYAAKRAIEWLRECRFMPDNGEEVKFPKSKLPPPPPSKKQKMGLTPPSPKTAPASAMPSAASSMSASATPTPKRSPVNPFDKSEVSSVLHVAELCQQLGFQAPAYRLTQAKQGYWTGYPEFNSLDGHSFPPGTGHVTDILGKNFAKEKIAEELMKELREVEAKRDKTLQEVLGS